MRPRSIIAGIAVLILALALWRLTERGQSPELQLTQLTFDPGLTGWPAISSDGRMFAYASDRDTGGNLELYLQLIRGGSTTRLTTTGDDNSEPAFSPDGRTLAYHSTRAGGGIYTLPAAGGEPALLAAGGHSPHYSPDGHSIAFSDSSGVYIVASSGGTPRSFHPEFASPGAAVWSPDGGSLIFRARGDLWVAPLVGGNPESTGVAARMAKAGLGSPVDDAIWTSSGLLFSARTGLVRNLYRCPLDNQGKASGEVVRLTNGTELMGDPSVSRDGQIVFSAGRQRFDIWAIPLDAITGKAAGPPYRITDTLATTANPDISPDGRRLIFGSSGHGFTEVWEKDLVTGKEWVAATGPEGATYGRLLKSSGGILYVQPTAGHDDVYMGNRKLALGTRPWDADSKEQTVLVSGAGIDALDISTTQRTPLLKAPRQTTLSEASFSPGDRWILFLAETPPEPARIYVAPAPPQPAPVYVAPPQGGEWLPISDGSAKVDQPRFSPDGRLIYFTLDHDGFRGIWAVRFDPQTGGVLSQPFPVFDPRAPRLSLLAVNRSALEIAVARDKLVTILCESTSDIWMGDLVHH